MKPRHRRRRRGGRGPSPGASVADALGELLAVQLGVILELLGVEVMHRLVLLRVRS
jgi:hypothetical protein